MPPDPAATRILVVDDHRRIRQPLAAYLRRHGHAVDTAEDAAGMRALLRRHAYDAVLLDVMLPDGDGFALCRQLRARHDLPVILMTARGEIDDRVHGLELGADDYVVKPFEPRELLARLQAVLRRCRPGERAIPEPAPEAPVAARVHRFAGWTYTPDLARLEREGAPPLRLTTAEARLLEAFLARPRQPLPRDVLLGLLTRPGEDVGERAIDRQVSRLRRKLDARGDGPLRTLWGRGYVLAADVQTGFA
ncbi:response regulator transcription factor [Luteimonas sp. XNQY3]|nr:response regulator transcription factor [Luteimonas sp. XNQY3]MCD9005069.1 response regulator transcription factor [Luteimonas sp. XNQY3]